ncbi:MAG: hypothetical protein FRX49_08189 [Trebouxia sp. A1-2]|nr:MAG: hypothetical protein FRX49_08189 [Trebouxia sp. A1-2]
MVHIQYGEATLVFAQELNGWPSAAATSAKDQSAPSPLLMTLVIIGVDDPGVMLAVWMLKSWSGTREAALNQFGQHVQT